LLPPVSEGVVCAKDIVAAPTVTIAAVSAPATIIKAVAAINLRLLCAIGIERMQPV
jgi:hypothetical protein